MDKVETIRSTVIFLLALLAVGAFVNIIDSLLSSFEIRIVEKRYKSEYQKYYNFIFNNEVLSLSRPKHLDAIVYSAGFKNNAELRRDFMQTMSL